MKILLGDSIQNYGVKMRILKQAIGNDSLHEIILMKGKVVPVL
jgi:hypothetical protein